MKNKIILILVQALLSTISGIMIANMSFVGKVGIGLFYTQYHLFKIWWQTALLLFSIQVVLVLLLSLIQAYSKIFIAKTIALVVLLLSGWGGYLTYKDFTTTSHRYMSSSFHFGFYIFWTSVAATAVYFLVTKKKIRSLY